MEGSRMVMTAKLLVLVALTLAGAASGIYGYETGLLVPDNDAPHSRVLPLAGRCYYDPRMFPSGFTNGMGPVDQSVPDPVPLPFPRDDFALVTWVGQDDPNGNGIKCYDVQYRFGESGEWTDWKLGTADTCAVFTPDDAGMLYFQEGTYQFRCRATDNSGNMEAYPAFADARFGVTYYTPMENIEKVWEYYKCPPVKVMDGPVEDAAGLAVEWYNDNIVSVPEKPVQDAIEDADALQ